MDYTKKNENMTSKNVIKEWKCRIVRIYVSLRDHQLKVAIYIYGYICLIVNTNQKPIIDKHKKEKSKHNIDSHQITSKRIRERNREELSR